MSADQLAMLGTLVMASEARWRALAPYEAARYVYHLQRLRMTLVARAGEVGNGAATDRCRGERS